ncbi:DUF4190 domain-containing protein [Micromonospora sp. DT48]|uniref:DUF4190 domain-containing protein n=1 Tax=Micromonospora sp. DT48 TaxID=3393429 RepID=UPI003CEC80CD
MQPGQPAQDPYGQQPNGDPTAPPPANPYAPPPANPYAAPANPYGQQPPADPYGQQQPPADPYGQQPSGQPEAQPPASPAPYDPYAPPAGQPPAYGQPAYGQPAYGQPYTDPNAPQPYGGTPMYPNAGFAGPQGQQNTLGLVAMILGIASIPLACCYLGIPLGLTALITGWLGKQKADQGLAGNSGQALAGLICGAVGLLLGVVQLVLVALNVSGSLTP